MAELPHNTPERMFTTALNQAAGGAATARTRAILPQMPMACEAESGSVMMALRTYRGPTGAASHSLLPTLSPNS